MIICCADSFSHTVGISPLTTKICQASQVKCVQSQPFERYDGTMALYSRSLAHQSRATNEIHNLLQAYPDGVTVRKLMQDNEERLKSPDSVLAAIDLLVEEGKAKREQSTGHDHYLDSIKVYPLNEIAQRGADGG
jgi:hypothetical protein